MTPAGIEPATFRFVAQLLNHCATGILTKICTVLSYLGVVYSLYMLYFKMCVYCCELSCVYCCRCLVCIVVVVLCVLLSSYVYLLYYVCTTVFTLDAGLLAISQYSEVPATGHLDTGFLLISLCL